MALIKIKPESSAWPFRRPLAPPRGAALVGDRRRGWGGISTNQQNSPQVAGATYHSVNGVEGSSTTGASTFVKSVAVGGGTPALAHFARSQIVRFEGLGYIPAGDSAAGLVTTIDTPCDTPSSGSTGSVNIKLNDADNSHTFSSGDTLDATFQNCYSATDKQTIDGAFSFTGFTLSGDPQTPGTAWNAKATFTFTNLSITDASSGTNKVNGGFTFSGNTSDGNLITSSLSGTSLSVQSGGTPMVTLQDFSISGTNDLNTTVFTEAGSGKVTDASLDGYFTFQISDATPLHGQGSQDPDSGELTITGNNSTLTLTANSGNVVLAGDTNGDGNMDFSITKAWTDLTP